jgi:hypothetical protein
MTKTNIHIFYHIAQLNNWRFIVQEQMHSMLVSGLLHSADCLHVGVNGPEPISGMPEGTDLIYYRRELWAEETPTLKRLRDFCKDNPNQKVLYIHSKGVTRGTASVNSWRLYMEYYCVHRWKDCVADLDTHDCVSCLWKTPKNPTDAPPHFSGNIWWSKSSYLNTLNHQMLESGHRYDREFWVGSGLPKVKNYGTEQADNCDFYGNELPSCVYITK